MPRRKLTDAFVKSATAAPGMEREIFWDTELRRFGLMVTAKGHKSFVLQFRDRTNRKQHRLTIPADAFDVKRARDWARDNKASVYLGSNPMVERRRVEGLKDTAFRAVAGKFLVDKAKLRSIKLIASSLERFAMPAFGERQIVDIKKSDIVRLRDRIARDGGPAAADYAVSVVARVLNWHEVGSDTYKAPSFKGLALLRAHEQARQHTLTDDELRAVWRATEGATGPFRPMLRFVLLTCTRRDESADMTWDELEGSDWTIPKERYKTKTELLIPLSEAARAVLAGIPRTKSKYVFATARGKPLRSFSRLKAELDRDSGVTDWTIHDLRRTARSLMSRAGVDKDHAERCLGHTKGGIRGVYDRHEYHSEKQRAFEMLAAQVERIVNPPQDNITEFRSRAG